ncbi:unnamed protein product [Prorocentrum cordatum]|uniref:Uncharacterized protein n=1 Tax=Prorocentrum cordatum TaxID=2364126 RepID=A0ABN9YA19_9DINO|nr:unnamed protein product [Polarella glacialis]
MMGTPRRWMTTTELANTNAQIIVSARSASATPRALGGARPSTPGTPRSPPGAGSTSRSYASSSASAGSARSLSGMIAARCIMGEAGCDKDCTLQEVRVRPRRHGSGAPQDGRDGAGRAGCGLWHAEHARLFGQGSGAREALREGPAAAAGARRTAMPPWRGAGVASVRGSDHHHHQRRRRRRMSSADPTNPHAQTSGSPGQHLVI